MLDVPGRRRAVLAAGHVEGDHGAAEGGHAVRARGADDARQRRTRGSAWSGTPAGIDGVVGSGRWGSRTKRTCSGSRPRSAVCSLMKLRISSPADVSSTSASATSATTSAWLKRARRKPPPVPLPPSRSAGVSCAARRLQRRHQAEEDAVATATSEREQQHLRVQPDHGLARDRGRPASRATRRPCHRRRRGSRGRRRRAPAAGSRPSAAGRGGRGWRRARRAPPSPARARRRGSAACSRR